MAVFFLPMSEKITLARLKKFGKNFEISIDPEQALRYRKGEIADVREVLLAERIFTDARKGLAASQQDLQQVFKTTDPLQISAIILKEGELPTTTEQRTQEREQKKRQLIYLLHQQAVDPRTGLPHPPERLEAAMEEAQVHVDEHRSAEEQLPEAVKKLLPVLPLKIAKKVLRITIPPAYIGKAYALVKRLATVLQELWKPDGSWEARVEIPAGFQVEFFEQVNKAAQGKAEIIVEKEN